MAKKILLVLFVFGLILTLITAGCAPEEVVPDEEPLEDKDVLIFGGSRSQSGPFAVFDEVAFGPIYRMWADEVNERGGIYVEEYGKQIPVELLIYDDTSDLGTMTRLLERLMVEDQVDFLLPPVSTAFLKTASELANENGYILLGAEGGAKELEPLMASLPYFFSILNHATHQVPALVDMLADAGVESAAIMFIADQHGIEYSGDAVPLLEAKGIEIIFSTSVPPEVDDVSALISEAQVAGADAFLSFCYPDQNFLLMGQMIEMGYSPDVLLLGPGGNFHFFPGIFGPMAEGVMSWGAWNEKSGTGAAEFYEKFTAYYGGEDLLDWWGHLPYYSSLQILEQAIERAGTLDQSVIRDIIATEEFETVMGTIHFVNGQLPAEAYVGQVGQWQNGKYEVIAPANQATAAPMVPKPNWAGQ
ncbi:MAG: amino acid ABC transporter substrate-binding protein [Bacillota bacterium]|nr:amino acid ABC transporter substrate-binding protein [Bacillota bacterium]